MIESLITLLGKIFCCKKVVNEKNEEEKQPSTSDVPVDTDGSDVSPDVPTDTLYPEGYSRKLPSIQHFDVRLFLKVSDGRNGKVKIHSVSENCLAVFSPLSKEIWIQEMEIQQYVSRESGSIFILDAYGKPRISFAHVAWLLWGANRAASHTFFPYGKTLTAYWSKEGGWDLDSPGECPYDFIAVSR